MATYNVLIMGASYGSLLATKLLFGGHKITMVCLPAEVEAFNSEGALIRMPIRGRKDPIELDSRKLGTRPFRATVPVTSSPPKCGRHFWSTYPPPNREKPAAAAPPVPATGTAANAPTTTTGNVSPNPTPIANPSTQS